MTMTTGDFQPGTTTMLFSPRLCITVDDVNRKSANFWKTCPWNNPEMKSKTQKKFKMNLSKDYPLLASCSVVVRISSK